MVKINVTQEHIDSGTDGNACHCPVALAIKDALGREDGVYVFYYGANVGADNYHLPMMVTKFIKDFDNEGRGSVSPFSFTLDLAQPAPDVDLSKR